MLNRFLSQVHTEKTDASKSGIDGGQAQTILDLLEAYTKNQLGSLSYKNRKDALVVNIHANSPTDKNYFIPNPPANSSVQDPEGVFSDWDVMDQEEHTPELKITGTPVRAHMSGSVYLKPNPTDPNFVSEGKTVKAGDVLCLLEAMKLFSEVKAPVSGVISRIFVEHGDIVKEGDALFEIVE